jgi:hypothetical protein
VLGLFALQQRLGRLFHQLQQGAEAVAALEFRLAQQASQPHRYRTGAGAAAGLGMAAEALAHQGTAALQLQREPVPIQSAAAELLAQPTLQWPQFGGGGSWEVQVQAGSGGGVFHKKHQQPVAAWHQP